MQLRLGAGKMTGAAQKFDDLPPETKAYLSRLSKEDIKLLQDGARLAQSIMTVGKFMRRVIILLLGILAGVVLFGESILKIAGWMKPP